MENGELNFSSCSEEVHLISQKIWTNPNLCKILQVGKIFSCTSEKKRVDFLVGSKVLIKLTANIPVLDSFALTVLKQYKSVVHDNAIGTQTYFVFGNILFIDNFCKVSLYRSTCNHANFLLVKLVCNNKCACAIHIERVSCSWINFECKLGCNLFTSWRRTVSTVFSEDIWSNWAK